MEDYRTKVIKLHAIYSRILANLPVKLTRMKVRGGLPSLLATVVAGLRLSGGECRWPPDFPRSSLATPETFAFQKALTRLIFTDFYRFLSISRTFLGDISRYSSHT